MRSRVSTGLLTMEEKELAISRKAYPIDSVGVKIEGESEKNFVDKNLYNLKDIIDDSENFCDNCRREL